MRAGELDALFYVGGLPAPAIAQLADTTAIDLLPMPSPMIAAFRKAEPTYVTLTVTPNSYAGLDKDVVTMGSYSLWVVNAKLSDKMAYDLLKALWHKSSKPLLAAGPANARQMSLPSALNGLTIPLHPGAAKFYTEMKVLKQPEPAKTP
jgi:TRAP transporter TAXI family solute receptor